MLFTDIRREEFTTGEGKHKRNRKVRPDQIKQIVAELVDAIMRNEVQVFLKNHNKISLATLIKMDCWFESNLSYNFT